MLLAIGVGVLVYPAFLLTLVIAGRGGVKSKGSQTMYFLAQQRQLGFRVGLCDDDLAHAFVPLFYRAFTWLPMLLWKGYRTLGSSGYGSARCNFGDEAVQEAVTSGCTQIVILGAGADTRLHRMPIPESVAMFEVDAPASQAIKLRRLPKERRRPDVVFVACNFEEQSWLEALEGNGFDAGQPTLFIWEGVSMYLTPQALQATLRGFGLCGPGTRVAFDYLEAPHRAWQKAGVKMFSWIGEPFRSMPTLAQLREMLDASGMRIVEHLDDEAVTARYLTHEHGFAVGRCSSLANFVLAQV